MSKGDTQQNNEIVIERASATDAISWDNYVELHGFASAYHRFAWLQAVKEAYGHEGFGIVAKNKETQCIVGVLPAVLMKTPL